MNERKNKSLGIRMSESTEGKKDIASLRTEKSKTFEMGGGRRKIITSRTPLHFKKDYSKKDSPWMEVDLMPMDFGDTLQIHDAPYDLVVDKNEVGFVYESKKRGRVRVRLLSVAGEKPIINPSGPEADYGSIIWKGVANDLDIKLVIRQNGVVFWKRLNSAAAPKEYQWEVIEEVPGLVLNKKHEGMDSKKNKAIVSKKEEIVKNAKIITETVSNKVLKREKRTRVRESSDIEYPLFIDVPDVTEVIEEDADDVLEVVNSYSGAPNADYLVDDGNYIPVGRDFRPATGTGFPNTITSVLHAGFRFQDVRIPQGAVINSATLKLTHAPIEGSPPNKNKIYGDDVDNAAPWSSASNKPTQIAKTSASALWTPGVVSTVTQEDIDVTSIVQEIVDRGGWVTENNIRFALLNQNLFGTNSQVVDAVIAFPYGSAYPQYLPSLEIDYTAWYHSDWLYRTKITSDNSLVDADVEGFDAVYNLADMPSSFWANVQSDGDDIRITSSDGMNELAKELVGFDSIGETGLLYFRGDLLDSEDTDFYIYYGNASAAAVPDNSDYGKYSVWGGNYLGVWHMEENPGGSAPQILDSTSAQIHGTTNGTMNSGDSVAGINGKGVELDGSDDYISWSDVADHDVAERYTFSVWAKYNGGGSGTYQTIASKIETNLNGIELVLTTSNDEIWWANTPNWAVNNTGEIMGIGDWFHLAITWDESVGTTMYVNGAQVAFDNTTGANTFNGPLMLGFRGDSLLDKFPGVFDEFKLSFETFSADWISTQYNNQIDPSAFWTTGTEEEYVPDEWYDEDWAHRVKIVVSKDYVSGGNHYDFPVYVDLSDLPADFFSHVRSDGGDIRVTSADGITEIPREVVFINVGSEIGEMHLRAPGLSNDENTEFYIYYGNSSATEPSASATYGRNNVWTNGYERVFHFQEAVNNSAGGYVDSTGNGNATGVSMALTEVDGALSGKAQDFDGSADVIDTNFQPSSSIFTFSAWFNHDSVSGYQNIMSMQAANYQLMLISGAGVFEHWAVDATNPVAPFSHDNAPGTGTWKYGVVTREGNSAVGGYKIYLDDVRGSVEADAGTYGAPSGDMWIGGRQDASQFFNGKIDEVRISSVERIDEWIETEYNNQSDTSTFYSVGPEEDMPIMESSSVSPSVSPSSSISPSSSVSPSPSPGYAEYSRGDYVALPLDDADLETMYTTQDYDDVETADNIRVGQTALGIYAIHLFKNYVGSLPGVRLTWEGQSDMAASTSTVYLQIYNRDTTSWETVDSDNSTGANTDFVLTAPITDVTDYKNSSNVIACRVYQQSV